MSNDKNNPGDGKTAASALNAPGPLVDLALVASLATQLEEAKQAPLTIPEICGDDLDTDALDPDKLLVVQQGKVLDLSAALLPVERITQTHADPESFAGAVRRWGRRDMTVQFMHPKDNRVVAWLDYHEDRSYLPKLLDHKRKVTATMAKEVEVVVAGAKADAATEAQKAELEQVQQALQAAASKVQQALQAAASKVQLWPDDAKSWSQNRQERRRVPRERVDLHLVPSEEFLAWTGIAGKEIEQATFAEFVEGHIEDIEGNETYAHGGAFLKVALELEGRRDVTWESKANVQTGDRHLVWKEQTGAVGGTIVPRRLRLLLRPFRGMPRREYIAAVQFRALPKGVTFRLDFLRLETVQAEARAEVASLLQTRTGYPVYVGEATS
jgi:Uncharacterized conserved protein (DUF2303)